MSTSITASPLSGVLAAVRRLRCRFLDQFTVFFVGVCDQFTVLGDELARLGAVALLEPY